MGSDELKQLWEKHSAAIDHAKAAMQGGELEAVRVAVDEMFTAIIESVRRLEDETGIGA